MIYDNILQVVGRTPVVRIQRVGNDQSAEIYAKCEFLNAGGSVKDGTIVIQGDHGTRISTVSARADNADRFGVADFWDGFGALFAYRGPGLAAPQGDRPTPLSRALADFARQASRPGNALTPPASPPADRIRSTVSSSVPSRSPCAPMRDAVTTTAARWSHCTRSPSTTCASSGAPTSRPRTR